MPNETGTGFLVGAMDPTPEQLSAGEFQKLRALLDVLRNEKTEGASEAIDWILTSVTELNVTSPDEILLQILWHYVNGVASDRCGGDDVDGVLASHHTSADVHWITTEELKTLEHTLTALRLKSWFGEWLAVQVYTIANANSPDDRFPVPLKIASTLTDWIKEDQDRLEAARDFARMRPDLLFPAPAEPQAAQEPPTAPEPQAATKQPAKARKPRRKASRAA